MKIYLQQSAFIPHAAVNYDRLQFCDAETQKKYFEKQFELAKSSNLPMFLHLRAATDDFLDIVQYHVDDFPAGVVHSFDSTASELENILKIQKLDIGLNGCSLKTEENVSVAKLVPIERLHFETDAPWCDIRPSHAGATLVKTKLGPVKDKKKHEAGCLVKGRNEPCNIRQVYEVVSGLKRGDGNYNNDSTGEDLALCQAVYTNSLSMFFRSSK